MSVLKTVKPDIAVAGTDVHDLRHRPSGEQGRVDRLEHGQRDWVVDARPDSVDYLGRKATKLTVVSATAKTDASGAFSVKLKAPKDFGGIHDIYAVVDGVQVAKGGFLVARSATISPKQGPIGTMITVTYTGSRLVACTRAARRSCTTTTTSAP